MENNTGKVIKKDGKLWLIICPSCGSKNHLDMMERGKCIWCDYIAQDSDVIYESFPKEGKQILHD